MTFSPFNFPKSIKEVEGLKVIQGKGKE